MTANHQARMSRARTTLFLGLGVLIALAYSTVLRNESLTGYEVAILCALTLAALLYDYLKVGQFLAVLNERKAAGEAHERSIQVALKTTVRSPLLLKLVRHELLSLYYAFFAKQEQDDTGSSSQLFSYVKSSNASDVFLFVALSQLPFLPFIHVWVEHEKGSAPAWVITVVTLWSVVWFLAQVQAARLRPIELGPETLKYRYGLVWSADIAVKTIKSARSVGVAEELEGRDLFESPLGSKKNVLLEFHEPVRFSGPYSLSTRKIRAAICLDNADRFLSELARRGVQVSPG